MSKSRMTAALWKPTILFAAAVGSSASDAAQNFDGGPFEWARSSWSLRRQMGRRLALRGANVIDVATGGVRENVNVLIQGDLIVSVGDDPLPERTEIVEAEGKYVIPGLIDLHAHVIPPSRFFPDAAPPEEALATLLDHGVTTIRCLPLFAESALVWSARVSTGDLLGPAIVPVSGIFEKEAQRTSRGFGDAATARRWVQKEALLGARWIKVYNSMDAECLTAIVSTAREHGMKVCGHAEDVAPRAASALGMSSIEHVISIPLSCLRDGAEPQAGMDLGLRTAWRWEQVDDDAARALMETFRANGTAWIPTLVVTERMLETGSHDGEAFADETLRPRLAAALRRSAELAVHLHRIGGLVGVGTDFPVDGVAPGSSVQRELELLVREGGATPLEALQMATSSSAAILGAGELLGAVEAERIADLVVLGANPLEDIANVRRVELVIHLGRRHVPRR